MQQPHPVAEQPGPRDLPDWMSPVQKAAIWDMDRRRADLPPGLFRVWVRLIGHAERHERHNGASHGAIPMEHLKPIGDEALAQLMAAGFLRIHAGDVCVAEWDRAWNAGERRI